MFVARELLLNILNFGQVPVTLTDPNGLGGKQEGDQRRHNTPHRLINTERLFVLNRRRLNEFWKLSRLTYWLKRGSGFPFWPIWKTVLYAWHTITTRFLWCIGVADPAYLVEPPSPRRSISGWTFSNCILAT